MLDLTPDEDTLEPVETWPIDRLRALQTERLRWTLRHAYERVPFHKHAFDAARIHPDDLDSLADLARFPFTTHRDLRAAEPFGLFGVPRARIARLQATPRVIGYTDKDIEHWRAMVGRSLRAAGLRPGWLVQGDGGMRDGIEKYGCAVVPDGCDGFQPEAIITAAGIDPATTGLRLAIIAGEQWSRSAIEDRFGIHAVAIGDPSGILGLGIAQECVETKDGLTLWEDHFYPEVIDPRTGRVLADGEQGELVITALTREAMPVIRYRTGTITRLLPGTARTMRRLGATPGPTG